MVDETSEQKRLKHRLALTLLIRRAAPSWTCSERIVADGELWPTANYQDTLCLTAGVHPSWKSTVNNFDSVEFL